MGKGQELYKKAKTLIPGGTMLLSKRPELYLPEYWPTYFSKAKGCTVWDLDGRELLDFATMGIGTNVLGYGNETVDNAVRQVVDKGNMSSLNCPEEVALAERLVSMHSWADMARFARTGGEANAVAIRIARAASGKDKVAICGYHGWHDWYLSANIGTDDSLGGHLLPGLDTAGVPQNLKQTVFPFNYNELKELERIVSENPDLGVIKMEVSRNMGPEEGFLESVREIATKNSIVLIFDECTSGFRQSFGGLHKIFGVEPDMAVFGKTLGNGYAITAILGKREIMQAAQNTFISSTFWTERIGPAAALATLDVMEETKSWEVITKRGELIGAFWKKMAKKYKLSIKVYGLPALISFAITSDKWLEYRTYIAQEMLKKNILATSAVYVTIPHEPSVMERYFTEIEPVFETISRCEQGELDIAELLDGPVSHTTFKRLN